MSSNYEAPQMEVFSFETTETVMDSGCSTFTMNCSEYDEECPIDGLCISNSSAI